ncbi:MAG: hypothetical protein J5590_04215 [Clostridia bacterium]|nr:hypothetical protein [Clostridia bacterium]
MELPKIKKEPLIPEYFPAVWQAVIFRNWDMIAKERIADVLKTTVDVVEFEARRMGLIKQKNPEIWAEKGYITIIRANWHLLPYEQLLKMLGWTENKLAYILKEEDFLRIKLGKYKPDCPSVLYNPLTEEQKAETERLFAGISNLRETPQKDEFDFCYEDFEDCKTKDSYNIKKPVFENRFIYLFSGLYDKAFDVDSHTYCPDKLLKKYSEAGINGIWLQGVLYRLCEFPFAPEMSEGYEKRLENLKDLTERAEKFGIKIFLYLNEPRSMPLSFFEKYPHLKGTQIGRFASMCLSAPEVPEYLGNAVEKLCRAVPKLGGFFTITMSENLTHCKVHLINDIPCEKCSDRPAWELAAEVNKIISEAAHRVREDIKVIAWDWSWHPKYGFDTSHLSDVMKIIPEDVTIMTKRETSLPFTRGGVSGLVEDYSISVDGISNESIKLWNIAKEYGHKTAAKVQINNSWECSTVPYIPVFRMLFNQIKCLANVGVDNLMLSWTLGGYPSPNIKLVSKLFFDKNITFEDAMKSLYGDKTDTVIRATDYFCKAFKEFPFDLGTLYLGPQNGGASNPLYNKPTGYNATMTCYAYDDLKSWRSIYPEDVFEKQFEKVCRMWKKGLDILEKEQRLYDIAYVSYSLFKSSYNQIRFIRLRDSIENRKELAAIVNSEKELAENVFEIMCRRPEVGFEAANHYYYSRQTMLEKIVNCTYLADQLKKM